MIKISDLTYEYFSRDEDNYLEEMISAIRGINFDAQKGEFVVIAGKNGSGKSTFARILNRLIVPIEGHVLIDGLDAMDQDNIREIRKCVGMVFQNPDDQIIGSVVDEDVAFGLENLGIEYGKMRKLVRKALSKVGFSFERNEESFGKVKKSRVREHGKYENEYILTKKVNELSGGEKQKVAIAGVLAMGTKCIVLDESTSMLDKRSRQEILRVLLELKEQGITIILITHIMDELLVADKIYVFDKGRILFKGTKEKLFDNSEMLKRLGLTLPDIVYISNELFWAKIIKKKNIYTLEGLAKQIIKDNMRAFSGNVEPIKLPKSKEKIDPVNAILIDNVNYQYGNKKVLENISLEIKKGEFIVLAGESGAGKSTLLQLIPGLIKPKCGNVYVDGLDIWDRTTDIRKIRQKIGFLFQFPERQLFGKNVYEDVVFGPRNVGMTEIEAEKRAYESIELVGLSQDIYDYSIDKLSGGQKRRVALAGVLAMNPEYLIMDEPTAGLDPQGRDELLELINILHEELGITIVMVTHDLDTVAKYSDRIVVLKEGKTLVCDDTPKGIYNALLMGEEYVAPDIMKLTYILRENGLNVDCICVNNDDGIKRIKEAL